MTDAVSRAMDAALKQTGRELREKVMGRVPVPGGDAVSADAAREALTPYNKPFACIGPMVYRTQGPYLMESVAQCLNGHTANWLCEQLNIAAALAAPVPADGAGDALREAAEEMLEMFTEKGHPGEPCVRTPWINMATIARWRAALAAPRAGATTPTTEVEHGSGV